MDAGRMAVCADPEGAVFCVWQANKHRVRRLVNEAGSLNFNGLNTRDVEGGEDVLRRGVRLGTLDLAAAPRCGRCPATATTLRSAPGPAQDDGRDGRPGRLRGRGRGINPIPADQPDTPAHWSVTFAVDDADATAAKAAELGGTVVVPPLDAPWSGWP